MKKPCKRRPSRAFADLKSVLDEVTSGAGPDTRITSKLAQATSVACEELEGATVASVEAKCPGFWTSVVAAHQHAARLLAADVADEGSFQLFQSTSVLTWGGLESDAALAMVALALLRGDALCVYAQILASVRTLLAAADDSSSYAGDSQKAGNESRRASPPAQQPDVFRLVFVAESVLDATFALMDALPADGPDGPRHTELLAALARSGVLEQGAAALPWLDSAIKRASGELAAEDAAEAAAAAAGRAGQTPGVALDCCVQELRSYLTDILQLHTWPPVPVPVLDRALPAQQLCARIVAGPAVQWLCLSVLQRCAWQPSEQGASDLQLQQQLQQQQQAWQGPDRPAGRRPQGEEGRGQADCSGSGGGGGSAADSGSRFEAVVAVSSEDERRPGKGFLVAIEAVAHVLAFSPDGSALATRAAAAATAERRSQVQGAQQPPPQPEPPQQQQAAEHAGALVCAGLLGSLRATLVSVTASGSDQSAVELAVARQRWWTGLHGAVRLLGQQMRPRQAAARLPALWELVAAALPTIPGEMRNSVAAFECLAELLQAAPPRGPPAPQPAASAATDQTPGQSVTAPSAAAPAAAADSGSSSSTCPHADSAGCSYSLRCALDAGLLPALEQLLRRAVAGLAAPGPSASAPVGSSAGGGGDSFKDWADARTACDACDALLCKSGVWPAVLAHAPLEQVVPLVATLSRAAAVAVDAAKKATTASGAAGAAATAATAVAASSLTSIRTTVLAGRLCLCLAALLEQQQAVVMGTVAKPIWRPSGFLSAPHQASASASASTPTSQHVATEQQTPQQQHYQRQQRLADWAALQWLPVLLGDTAFCLMLEELSNPAYPVQMSLLYFQSLLAARLSRSLVSLCRHCLAAAWRHSRSAAHPQQRQRPPSAMSKVALRWCSFVGKHLALDFEVQLRLASSRFYTSLVLLRTFGARPAAERPAAATAAAAAGAAAGSAGTSAPAADSHGGAGAGTPDAAAGGAGARGRGRGRARDRGPAGGRGGGEAAGRAADDRDVLAHMAVLAGTVMDLAELAIVDVWAKADGDVDAFLLDGCLQPLDIIKVDGSQMVQGLRQFGLQQRPRLEAVLLMACRRQQQQGRGRQQSVAAAAAAAAPEEEQARAALRAAWEEAALALLDDLAARCGLADPSLDPPRGDGTGIGGLIADPVNLGRQLLRGCGRPSATAPQGPGPARTAAAGEERLSSETSVGVQWEAGLLESQDWVGLCCNPACRSLDGPTALLPPGAGKVCARCRAVRYCCGACQLAHWRQGGHDRECADLKRQQEQWRQVEQLVPQTGQAQATAAAAAEAAGEEAAEEQTKV
ncbi:hypothetical protein HXX76_009222 [Chlamydomonas incerta]|uniref:phytol kinase n=1 Tax=Chlamydomonas incerta TaxID=51695 RepID=A0A835W0K2_CHLIN|nr:hypothetical protein HXX76_009222 [Chlamydomonas incerta]|eukprot:KAG2431726.1 hypothetical protein HXX76_009222 [Chlamydomonas incerta]